jgi:hypothetical protein
MLLDRRREVPSRGKSPDQAGIMCAGLMAKAGLGGVMGNDFNRAIARMQTGQAAAVDAAAGFVSRLTEEEKLWLLDGDRAFWPGILGMVAKGFSGAPVVAGAVPGTRQSHELRL